MADLELHIVFGTGPVGQATARELVKRGKAVKLVNRSGKKPEGIPDGVPVVAGDVFDAAQAKDLAQDATHVYQCTNPPYHEWVAKFPALQANTLEAAASAGARPRPTGGQARWNRPRRGRAHWRSCNRPR